jgi:glycine/D-amino acid oxidase-like deaminating enzyme
MQNFGTNKRVVGAISYEAGALWPYRLVATVWNELLNHFPTNLTIETSTPAQTIEINSPAAYSPYPYKISTPRGTIQARHVVHATNAFASTFVPGLRGKMVGTLVHMTAQSPEPHVAAFKPSRSWSVIYGKDVGFDFITQRPSANGLPGDLMLGGGFTRSDDRGLSQIGVYDDSQTDALTLAHLYGVFPAIFDGKPSAGSADSKAERDRKRTKKAWSGIIGVTGDFLPFVGRLHPKLTGRHPKRRRRKVDVVKTAAGSNGTENEADVIAEPGEWVSAAYSGDGMTWAWLCGCALGIMISGCQNEDLPPMVGRPAGRLNQWFPKELYVTTERLKKANMTNLANDVM